MTTIAYLTRIEFDFGAVAQLPAIAAQLGMTAPLLVTDPGLLANGLAAEVQATGPLLQQAAVFAETPANPTEAAARAALEAYRAGGCDGLIALGGGSPIDLAKAVALLARHDGPLARYAAVEGGIERIGPTAPLIAVPTTAGTGSEVGRGALITLDDGRKLGLISPHLIPRVALCDPALTLGLPRGLTAATGLDAIAHCVETFLSPKINPVADAIALDGLARAAGSVEIAVADGQNRQARWEMMMAALQGGLSFQKGLGAVHALSHPLGALRHLSLHHGTLNAILLPHVLEANAPACGEKYARMRRQLEMEPDTDLADACRDLNRRLELPESLGEIGVGEADLDAIAEAAVLDHCAATNPVALSVADYRRILDAAL